jgi:mRNA interferase MazF
VILADAGRGDWILCQVTSNPYGDPRAIPLSEMSFREGSLQVMSYARPGKLFTASHSLVVAHVATLTDETFAEIIRAVSGMFTSTVKT